MDRWWCAGRRPVARSVRSHLPAGRTTCAGRDITHRPTRPRRRHAMHGRSGMQLCARACDSRSHQPTMRDASRRAPSPPPRRHGAAGEIFRSRAGLPWRSTRSCRLIRNVPPCRPRSSPWTVLKIPWHMHSSSSSSCGVIASIFFSGRWKKEKLCARCMVVASCYLCCLRKKNRQFCDLERNVEGW